MLSVAALCPTSFAGAAFSAPRASVTMESAAELKALADKLNPVVGYWDPMNLAEYDQFSVGQEASIGFLRQAEIKHGRVAMAAFVGYCVQANGICFPWNLQAPFGATLQDMPTIAFSDISAAGGPADQWDALPT